MERLDGQVAIVTGGARGIGLGIATVLRAEGANVVIADIDESAAAAAASLLCETGEHAAAVRADVTAKSDVERLAAAAVRRWGSIDILAANAGIYPHIRLGDISVTDWDQVMAINVKGAMLAIQACLPQMTRQGYGRIVLTSSITGSVVGQPGYAHLRRIQGCDARSPAVSSRRGGPGRDNHQCCTSRQHSDSRIRRSSDRSTNGACSRRSR